MLPRYGTAVNTSNKKIDLNRFARLNRQCTITLPNRNEKISIQCHSYNALATCITVLQDHVMTHIRGNVATRFCKRQSPALLQCGSASHGFGGLVQQLQDRAKNPFVMVSCLQWIETN